MAFKFVAFATLLAAANAGILPATYVDSAHSSLVYTPVAKTLVKAVDTEFDHHPQYSYSYGVQDALTGDAKSQHESRNGDVVKGSYSLVDADGTKRTVDYVADDYNGFNAVVRKEPAHLAVKVATPLAHTPLVHRFTPTQTFPISRPALTEAESVVYPQYRENVKLRYPQQSVGGAILLY